MGKPKAPAPPDYAAAATAQGEANINSAIASNFLNQASQVGPYGSMTYSYDKSKGYTLPDGTVIPAVTATTTLSPDQQKLLDQNNALSIQLNNLAKQGITNVGKSVNTPIDLSTLPAMQTSVGGDLNAARNSVTDAYMARLQPYIDRDRAALDTKLANQGITQGSEAYGADQDTFNRGVNDQRIAALLAGDQEAQNMFNRGLASAQFGNQTRNQALQEAEFMRTEPLNLLNALRSGNQVNLPSFGNVTGGAQINAAPMYQATQDAYNAQLQNYQQKMANYGSVLSGLGSIGGAFAMSDRRLKTNIKRIGTYLCGAPMYVFNYIWGGAKAIGAMADEVAIFAPKALGPQIVGYATVDYGKLR